MPAHSTGRVVDTLVVGWWQLQILADEDGNLSMPRQILAGAGAGFFQVCAWELAPFETVCARVVIPHACFLVCAVQVSATNPMEIVKIRMQMQGAEGVQSR